MDNKLRAKWSQESLSAAVLAVLMGHCSKKKAAKTHGIPRGTLQRHIKKTEAGQGVMETRLGRTCTLIPELEENLRRVLHFFLRDSHRSILRFLHLGARQLF